MSDLLYGINPVREALGGEGRRPLELYLARGDSSPRIAELESLADRLQLKVSRKERRELDRLAGHNHHQGTLLRLEPFSFTPLPDLLQLWRDSGRQAFFLLLDSITDPHNLGAMIRSAEVAGCHGVILSRDRSCSVTPVVEKTAAGALSHLPVCQVTNLARTIDELKQAGVWCYGLAGDDGAESLFEKDLKGDIALVVGSEGKGLRPNIRNHCDGLLAIPMRGRISSLNASVAAAVAMFEVVRQGGAG